jgi:hypothetical protein
MNLKIIYIVDLKAELIIIQLMKYMEIIILS